MSILNSFFKSTKQDIDINELLDLSKNRLSLLMVSASCCNPLAIPTDEKMKKRLNNVLSELKIESKLHVVTLTSAQSVLKQLDKKYESVAAEIMGIFQSKGLGGFPILIINNKVAFYGGVPEEENLKVKISEILNQSLN
ncbi:MAG: hypothetical protein HOO91_13605 [Bacteroidales bacterium]|nr:hypothetical protein [Bacteroidales bacterium]